MGKRIDDLLTYNPSPLQRTILFRKQQHVEEDVENQKKKFTPLNPPTNGTKKNIQNGTKNQEPEGFVPPKQVLFQRGTVENWLTWKECKNVGPGLVNLGNTCFLNSVLQSLTATPPLANYMKTQEHSKNCRVAGFCMMCELETHFTRYFSHSGKSLSPNNIVSKLRNIAKHMRFGRQEDAHEFIRYVIEGLQKGLIFQYGDRLDAKTKETSLIHQIFGGYLESEVVCSQCSHSSCVFEPFLDLSLEIKSSTSIDKALQMFTRTELLSGDNKYRCEKCKKLVDAKKQFRIFQAPNVLAIHLKRFKFMNSFGGKISKFIEYPEVISLKPYMSKNTTGPENPTYRLYSVLVHEGHSINSGHYYSYIKSSTNAWYCMDDSHVSEVGLKKVLGQCAYILFYVLDPKCLKPKTSQIPTTIKQNGHQNGTINNSIKNVPSTLQNGINGTTELNGSKNHLNGNGKNQINITNPFKKESSLNGKSENQSNGENNLKRKFQENGNGNGNKKLQENGNGHINGNSQLNGKTSPNEKIHLNGNAHSNGINETTTLNEKVQPNKKPIDKMDIVNDIARLSSSSEDMDMLPLISTSNLKNLKVEDAKLIGSDSSDSSDEDEHSRKKRKLSHVKVVVNENAPILQWDTKREAIKGKGALNKVNKTSNKTENQFDQQVHAWDQQRNAELLKEREKLLQTDAFKFVPKVVDELDYEYDLGKKKKNKKKNKNGPLKSNPFQNFANQTNRLKR